MDITLKLEEKIRVTLKNNDDLMDRILQGDVDAIREIGHISQQNISPLDVVESYENGTIDYLYNYAKKCLELQELYDELCEHYYKQEVVGEEKKRK